MLFENYACAHFKINSVDPQIVRVNEEMYFWNTAIRVLSMLENGAICTLLLVLKCMG